MHKTLLVCSSLVLFLATSILFPKPTRAQIVTSPTSLSFGNVTVNGAPSAQTFVITNESEQSRTIQRVYNSAAHFTVAGPAMPLTLAPGASASFQVKFAPSSAASYSGYIIVSIANATYRWSRSSSMFILVKGTGIAGNSTPPPSSPRASNPTSPDNPTLPLTYLLSESTSSLTFANTMVGSSTSLAVSLTNSGTGAVIISQAAVSGSGFSLSGFSGSTTVAAGSSLTLTVNFTPTAAGTTTGGLSIASNATNSLATISLSGTGVQPQISVVPGSISFTNASVGATNTQSLTVKNTGTANLTISQASLAGSSFTYSGLAVPFSLAPGASSSFTVAFTPASASSFYANLALTNNSPTSPLTIPLSGTSVASVLQLSASTTSLSFGSVTTGTSSPQTVTLTNTGNSSVTLSSISVAGTGFSSSGITLPLTLAAGQSTSFSVIFAPTSTGALTGTVTVVSNASNSPLSVALSGTGTAPASYSVSLSWTSGSSSASGFNVYRGSQSAGPFTKMNSSLLSTTLYTDTTVASGQTYYYVATDVDTAGNESAYSNVASAVIP